MIKTVSATDAVRTFSDLLNAVKYQGRVLHNPLRGGKPAATIGPAEKSIGVRTLKELSACLNTLPAIEEKDIFASDLEGIINNNPTCLCVARRQASPETSSWG